MEATAMGTKAKKSVDIISFVRIFQSRKSLIFSPFCQYIKVIIKSQTFKLINHVPKKGEMGGLFLPLLLLAVILNLSLYRDLELPRHE